MTEVAAIYDAGQMAVKKDHDMQQIMLQKLLGTNVFIHLVNGVRLAGKLTAHDRFTVVLDAKQIVFKHAITTIQQTEREPVRWGEEWRKPK